MEPRDYSEEDTGMQFERPSASQHSSSSLIFEFIGLVAQTEMDKPLLPHQEAAILLEYARDGQDLNGSRLTFRSRLCYRLRHKYHWAFRLAAWSLVLIQIFERPVWTYAEPRSDHWNDGYSYPSFRLPYLPNLAAAWLTLFFLLVLWLAVGMELGYKLGTSYSYLPFVSAVILFAKSVDVVVLLVSLGLQHRPIFTMSPLEAFMCVLVELQYDNNIGYLLRTLPKFAVLIVALALAVCMFTALGLLIIDPNSDEARVYFPNFGVGLWSMLMVLNGSNWPGPMIPAFNHNRGYAAYFFSYIVVCGWGLLNLVLGFNYLSFQREQQLILEMRDQTKTDNTAAAFRILDVENRGFLTYAQVDELLQEMYTFYEEIPDGPTPAERYELILILDIQSNLMIDENDFGYIEEKCFQGALRVLRSKKRTFTRYVRADLIAKRAQLLRQTARRHRSAESRDVEDPTGTRRRTLMSMRRNSTIEHASRYAGRIADPKLLDLYRSIEIRQYLSVDNRQRPTPVQWLAYYAMHIDTVYFDIACDSAIVLLGIPVLLNSRNLVLIDVYTAICLGEGVLKLFVQGSYRYWRRHRNLWDGTIGLILLLLVVVQASTRTRREDVHIVIKTTILIRTLLFPRNVVATNGFKAFRSRHRLAFDYALQTAGHFSFLLLVLVVMIYVFAGLGQNLFRGLICRTCGHTEAIEASAYGLNGYWPLNFNDMPSGMVTMFTLLTVNNMHITASGFVAAESQWAEVFFASWYALGVLLLLNVLTAVFLNQFTGYLSQLAMQNQPSADTSKGELNHLPPQEEHHVGQASINSVDSVSQRDDQKPDQVSTHIPSKEGETGMSESARNADHKLLGASSPRHKAPLVRRNSFGLDGTLPTAKTVSRKLVAALSFLTVDESFVVQTEDAATAARSSQEDWGDIPRVDERNSLRSPRSPRSRAPSAESVDKAVNIANADRGGTAETPATRPRVKWRDDDAVGNISRSEERSSPPASLADTMIVEINQPQYQPVVPQTPRRARRSVSTSELLSPSSIHILTPSPPSGRTSSRRLHTRTASMRSQDSASGALSENEGEFERSIFASQANRRQLSAWVHAQHHRASAGEFPRLEISRGSGNVQASASPEISGEALSTVVHDIPALQESQGNTRPQGDEPTLPLERAAALFVLAHCGHERSALVTARALWSFRMRMAWTPWLQRASIVFAVLKFFQRPLWAYRHGDWDNHAIFPTSGLPVGSVTVIGCIRLPLLLLFLGGLTLELLHEEPSDWSDFRTSTGAARWGMLLLCATQVLLVLVGLGGGPESLVAVASIGSALYVLWFHHRVFKELQVVMVVLPRLSTLLVVAAMVIFCFAGFGPYLFNIELAGATDDVNQEYFGSFGTATWSIFVAITSSNYPNQILPAYRDDRVFFLFFFGFMCTGAFVLLNLVVATVFVEFQRAAQVSADVEIASAEVMLIRAFIELDATGQGYVTQETVQKLLEDVCNDYSACGLSVASQDRAAISASLSDGEDVTERDFLHLLQAVRAHKSPAKVAGKAASMDERNCFGAMVHWKYFSCSIGAVICVLIVLMLSLNARNLYQRTLSGVGLSATIVAILVIEVTIKLYVCGHARYFAGPRHRADFSIAVGAMACLVGANVWAAESENPNGFDIALRILLMLRLFLFPRNLRYALPSRWMRSLSHVLRRVWMQTIAIGSAFLCVSYLFASIGLLCFGGAINKNPSAADYDALMNSRYGGANYFGLNFNDFLSAWLTLFSCIHVSDFDLVASGFVATSGQLAKLFFATWYIIGVLLMLNILKAVFLGEFLTLFLTQPEMEGEDVDEGEDVQDVDLEGSGSIERDPHTED